MHVSALYLYPVKSLRGLAVNTAHVDPWGFEGDRRFLVIDEDNRFLTQRAHPIMATIETGLTAESLLLSHPKAGTIQVPRRAPGEGPRPLLREVTIWRDTVVSEDCGHDVADFLSSLLGRAARLVRMGPTFSRPVHQTTPPDLVSFADGFPILVISEASLADLNCRIEERGGTPVPMNRFRPNMVVADAPPFAEDSWTRFRIGSVDLRAGGPCARCIMTTTDQTTGVREKEPLVTLATYRRDPTEPTNVNFGQNVVNESKTGSVRVGDQVVLPPVG